MAAKDVEVIQKTLCGAYSGNLFVTYSLDNVPAGGSQLFKLPLFSKQINNQAYINPHSDGLNENAYAIQLLQYSIGCLSSDYNVRFLNVNNEGLIDTYSELYRVDGINLNLSVLENSLVLYYINHDSTLSPYFYVFIENNAGGGTSTIKLEFVYKVLKTKESTFV